MDVDDENESAAADPRFLPRGFPDEFVPEFEKNGPYYCGFQAKPVRIPCDPILDEAVRQYDEQQHFGDATASDAPRTIDADMVAKAANLLCTVLGNYPDKTAPPPLPPPEQQPTAAEPLPDARFSCGRARSVRPTAAAAAAARATATAGPLPSRGGGSKKNNVSQGMYFSGDALSALLTLVNSVINVSAAQGGMPSVFGTGVVRRIAANPQLANWRTQERPQVLHSPPYPEQQQQQPQPQQQALAQAQPESQSYGEYFTDARHTFTQQQQPVSEVAGVPVDPRGYGWPTEEQQQPQIDQYPQPLPVEWQGEGVPNPQPGYEDGAATTTVLAAGQVMPQPLADGYFNQMSVFQTSDTATAAQIRELESRQLETQNMIRDLLAKQAPASTKKKATKKARIDRAEPGPISALPPPAIQIPEGTEPMVLAPGTNIQQDQQAAAELLPPPLQPRDEQPTSNAAAVEDWKISKTGRPTLETKAKREEVMAARRAEAKSKGKEYKPTEEWEIAIVKAEEKKKKKQQKQQNQIAALALLPPKTDTAKTPTKKKKKKAKAPVALSASANQPQGEPIQALGAWLPPADTLSSSSTAENSQPAQPAILTSPLQPPVNAAQPVPPPPPRNPVRFAIASRTHTRVRPVALAINIPMAPATTAAAAPVAPQPQIPIGSTGATPPAQTLPPLTPPSHNSMVLEEAFQAAVETGPTYDSSVFDGADCIFPASFDGQNEFGSENYDYPS